VSVIKRCETFQMGPPIRHASRLSFNYDAHIIHQPTSSICDLRRPTMHQHAKFHRNQTVRSEIIAI